METRKRALVGECISRASVEAARGAALADIDAAIAACDYERAATLAFGRARAGESITTDVVARILPGIELPAITCSLIAIAPVRRDLIEVLDRQLFPHTKDAAELEAITLYAAWKAGAETARLIPHVRRLSARSLTAESYALVATVAATIDDPNVVAATKPIAPFAKEYAKNVATDDKAMHASLEAVIAELPSEVEASTAAGFTVRAIKQPGRNDSCSCGSGLKFKKCCADKPQAAPSPVPGLSWDEFLAGDRITFAHIEELGLKDLVRIDVARLGEKPLTALCRRFIVAHEWAHARRVLDEAGRKATFSVDDLRYELALSLLDVDVPAARALAATLPPELADDFALDFAIADGPAEAYKTLVARARAAVGSAEKHPDLDLAYTLLRAEPALGIVAARACIGAMHVDDAELLLDLVEEARDQLNLPPGDPAWEVFDELVGDEDDDEAPPKQKLDSALAESSARVDQLERTLATTRAELADARTLPAAALMRAPEATSGGEAKVRELEGLIREGNAERRELRKQLEAREAESVRERQDSPRARRLTLDEPDDGFDELGLPRRGSAAEGRRGVVDETLEPGARAVTLPRFERRFVDAIGDVPATVAAETMRNIGTLSAGDGFAWRGVKQAKDMARQVLMARIGIHHRLIFRVEGEELIALDLITREQLDTTLRRLRMNR